MIKVMITGAVVGVLFFCAWSLWKIVFQGAAVNLVYHCPSFCALCWARPFSSRFDDCGRSIRTGRNLFGMRHLRCAPMPVWCSSSAHARPFYAVRAST